MIASEYDGELVWRGPGTTMHIRKSAEATFCCCSTEDNKRWLAVPPDTRVVLTYSICKRCFTTRKHTKLVFEKGVEAYRAHTADVSYAEASAKRAAYKLEKEQKKVK